MEPRRPQALEAGLFLIVVAAPIAVFPLSLNPYTELKTALLALGALMIWSSGIRPDPRLALATLAWVLALGLAAITGVDRTMSILGPIEGVGALTLVLAASLLVIGPSIPAAFADRVRGWVVWAGLAVAVVQILDDLLPATILPTVVRELELRGSTLGNPLFSAAFLVVPLIAVVSDERVRGPRLLATLAVLSAGFAANGERSALLVPVVGLAAAWWLVRPSRRRVLAAGAVLVCVLAAWVLIDAIRPTTSGGTSGAVAQFDTGAAEELRLAVYRANFRAFEDRPILGWGPGNGWSGYLSVATAGEVEVVGRYWLDAHNLLLESLVTTGLIGAVALVFLGYRTARSISAGAPSARWAAAAALALLAWHAYAPMNVLVTPLLFLLCGIAARPAEAAPRAAPAPSWGRRLAIAGLAAGLLASSLAITASALERWSRSHYAEWAIRAAVAVQPWRLSAQQRLAIELALDGRSGDAAAGAEARDLADRIVAEHPWNPDARITAAGVENLLRNFPGAQDWIREQHRRFPNESIPVPTEETNLSFLASSTGTAGS